MNLPRKIRHATKVCSTNSGHSRLLLTAALFAASTLSSNIWAATLQGTTFLDQNNNSRQEPSEPILSNKTTTIFLRHNPTADAGEGGFYTTETTDGNYSFILHQTGSYTLWSSMDFGWEQTLPVRGEGIAFYDFTVNDGEQTLTIDFGFFGPNNAGNTASTDPTPEPNIPSPPVPPMPSEPSTPSEPSQPDEADVTSTSLVPAWTATLQGTMFLDDNQNGLKNQAESPLANETVFLRDNAASEGGFYTTQTDSNGNYSFLLHNTGPYTLWNEIPIGWQQTSPIRGEGIAYYELNLAQSDKTVTIDIGLFQPTTDNAPQVPDTSKPAPPTEDNSAPVTPTEEKTPTDNNPTPSAPKDTHPTPVTPTDGNPTPAEPTDDNPTPSAPKDNTPPAPPPTDNTSAGNLDETSSTSDWSGTLQGTAFLDQNNNGRQDNGEPSLPTKTTLFLRHNPTADTSDGGFFTTSTDDNSKYSFILHETGSYTLWSSIPTDWQQTSPIRGEGIAYYDFNVTNNDTTITLNFGFSDNGSNKPNQPPYRAEWAYPEILVGEPDTQLPIQLTLTNTGSLNDKYTISLTQSADWKITGLPKTVTVNSQQRKDLPIQATLPAIYGAETLITVTAQSQNDSAITAMIRLEVAAEPPSWPRAEGDDNADLTLVIDDTAMMAGEYLKIANALENQLAAHPDANGLLTLELITFKDDVVSRLVTTDLGELIGLLRSLLPAGGDDCPNASITALQSALPYLSNHGQILLVTAAPPHNTDTAEVIAQAQQQSATINVILSGTCGQAEADRTLYQNLADQTGGHFQWLPRGLTPPEDREQVIATTIATILTPRLTDDPINDHSEGDNYPDNYDNTDPDVIDLGDNLDLNQPTPATCQLYGVTEDTTNHRVLFTYNPKTDQVSSLTDLTELGQMPAMTAHPDSDILYYVALSTLHQLNAQTGQPIEIGPTGLDNIISLTFDGEGQLWAWAADTGLVQLDTNTGQGTLMLPTQLTLKAMTTNLAGTALYGLIGTELWHYEPTTNDIAKLCTNLPPKAQVIKVLPETILSEGLILLGLNQEQTVNLQVFDLNTCQPVANKDITMPYQLHRLGEFTVPMAACRQ